MEMMIEEKMKEHAIHLEGMENDAVEITFMYAFKRALPDVEENKKLEMYPLLQSLLVYFVNGRRIQAILAYWVKVGDSGRRNRQSWQGDIREFLR